ncbi:MAG: penicillin-binding transpeptidase domain-containing protein [Bryobacteraceae bacterium]|nr:penicillin-binding transpeptidase domain-containing protein [Bryobacteraceae bacterium]MDW8379358.1 penicillin-binding transpeptidase domain-containing protein [Bryobacterales bacterium]
MSTHPSAYFDGGCLPEPPAHKDAARRLRNLARLGFFWAVVILGKLVHLQIVSHEEFVRLAASQQQRTVEIAAPRGMIFDREGQPLAMSLPVKSVLVNPLLVRDVSVVVEFLSRILELDAAQLRKNLEAAIASKSGFLWVKRRVSPEQAARLESLKLAGVEFRDETSRRYPKGALAAHVLGSVDHEEKGNAGIELGLQEELEGIPGSLRLMTDVARRGYESRIETPALPGKNITLTIDERIQYVAEKALHNAVADCACKSGSVVVMNPRNGDILAMASFPSFDPNEPVKDGEDLSARLNLAIAAPFEPGSVFKVITLSAALETTPLRPDSLINCYGGKFSLFGRSIGEAKGGFGVIPMRAVLAKSSNIGAVQIGLAVGVKSLYDFIVRFGFGRKTGIPLPSESPGKVHPPREWTKTSMGSVAMGHEVTTTTLQLAQAAAIVANNGVLVRPRLVLFKQRPGEPIEHEPVAPGVRVLRAETAALMRSMLEDVILPGGTGTKARLSGYSAGGKTGSAQIYDFKLNQYTHKYNASFMGLAPLSNPALVVVVTLNGSPKYGGEVAAPVFREIAQAALRILEVPKDRPETMLLAQEASKQEQAESTAKTSDSRPSEAGGEAALIEGPSSLAGAGLVVTVGGVRAPNFLGKNLRTVLSESAAAGLVVEARGQGLAKFQRPAPGSILQPGERIYVQLAQ